MKLNINKAALSHGEKEKENVDFYFTIIASTSATVFGIGFPKTR